MDEMKPSKRAYQVNIINLDCSNESIARGYVYEPFYAENEKDARKKALKFLSHDCGIEEDYLQNPLTYITVKVKRYPIDDLIFVDGRLRTREQIKSDNERKERDDSFRKMLADNPWAMAFIRKGGYYYRPGNCGYTEFESEAGVYTIDQAVRECLGMSLSDYMRPVLIDVTKHNKMINDKIESLKTRLL